MCGRQQETSSTACICAFAGRPDLTGCSFLDCINRSWESSRRRDRIACPFADKRRSITDRRACAAVRMADRAGTLLVDQSAIKRASRKLKRKRANEGKDDASDQTNKRIRVDRQVAGPSPGRVQKKTKVRCHSTASHACHHFDWRSMHCPGGRTTALH